ncbi:1-phosphatidylinositol 4,5-bisphosphate phosphodiesterase eta-2-like isoform X3 [Bolinopsis microptera]|uniref:1-phosphatidylinositol 4,5-bisphosphate phosphodiesterase eta-2-like isoform X3 n=1 Tax=Bolinopsis microptera TaxID=2820187 RepID=UPI003079B769
MADQSDSPTEDQVQATNANGQDGESSDSKPAYVSQTSLDRATKERLIKQKSVSFSADPDDSMIITGARDCLSLMASGSDFIKIKPGAREFQRQFYFDQETLSIHWLPSRKKTSKILVEDIVSVQMGQKTESFRTAISEYPSSRCFSIMLRDNSSVDLVALVPNEAYIWVKGLRCLVTGGLGQRNLSNVDEEENHDANVADEEHKSTAEELRDRWLEEIYYAADLNHDGTLEHIEFLELLESLNKHLTTLHVVKKFKESDLCFDKGGTLSLDQFKSFYKQIVNRPEVHVVLARYATNNDYLCAEDLQLFLQAEQGVWNITVQECDDLIQKYEPTSDGKANNYMTVDGFSCFLMSSDNHCYDIGQLDTSHPITDYYVKTSFSSGCKGWPDEPELSKANYKEVLKNNFRCIRLEVWDGTEGPVVWHKLEETNRLSLQRVLQTINTTAFEDSELPLFINLESHCSPTQNVVVAKLFKDVFQDRLFSSSSVPTLADVKQKVLIKAKSLYKEIGSSNGTVNSDDSDNEIINSAATLRKRKKKNGPTLDDNLNMPTFFASYVDEKDGASCNYAAQLQDAKIDNVIRSNSGDLIRHNRENFSIIQPQTFYNNIVSPLGQWQCGCQFVSVYNAQQDFTTMLNRCMFMQQGGKGLALKPEILRRECYHYSLETETHIAGIQPKHLNIRLISAQQLPKPEGSVSKIDTVDPYIVVRIIGIPQDSHEYRTYAVKNDGFHPVWEEDVSFSILNPECALLHILMLDDDFIGDDYIGQVLVPLKTVRQGFRHLPLCARDGSTLEPASVFVHIDLKDQLDISIKKGIVNAKKKAIVPPKTERLRETGLPNIDSKLKESQATLDVLTNLVLRFRTSLVEFKISSGLDCFAHVRHCLRLLDLRLQTNDCSLSISEDESRGVPKLSVSGVVQVAAVQKAIQAFDNMTDSIHQMQTEGDSALEKVASLITNFDMYRKELMEFVEGNAGKKMQKALQNYSHNLWLLREYRELYNDTLLEKQRMLQHIYAHTSSKIKRGSWMLRKAGAPAAKLLSISENSSSGSIGEDDPAEPEVFEGSTDGILRPSTKVPTKSSLKQSASSPVIDYPALLNSTELEVGDI